MRRLLVLLVALTEAFAARAAVGEEFAARFWFRFDAYPVKTMPVAYGFRVGKADIYPEGGVTFSVSTAKSVYGGKPTTYDSPIESSCATGVWHHAAFSYSLAKDEFRIWFDGRVQNFYRPRSTSPRPLDPAALAGVSKLFTGEVFGLQTWDAVPSEEELLASPIPPGDLTVTARALVAAAKTAKNASFGAACAAAAKRLKPLASGGDVREYFKVRRLADDVEQLGAWSASAVESSAVLTVGIPRFSGVVRVPYRLPYDGRPLGDLGLAAAQGEIDCATFLARPYRDVKAFDVKPSALTGPGGATIPAEAVDVRVVSAWYETRWGWSSFQTWTRNMPVRIPELLLHDDALMKVDVATHRNYLRLSEPEGPRYVCVSEREPSATAEKFNYDAEPVRDAAHFVPLALEEGEWRQFWITVRVPADAPGGAYAGTLAFAAEGVDAGALPVRLTVHPFRLPRAATHYNVDRPMYGTWMNHCALKNKLAGSHDLGASLRRLESEFRNMAEHNMANPWATCLGPEADWTVAAMRRAGCETRPFFGGVKISWDFALMSVYPPRPGADISVAGNLEKWTREMVAYTNQAETAMAEAERRLGHREVYSYAYDEGGDEFVRRDMPFFATLQAFGGRTFVTGGFANAQGFITDLNDAAGPPSATRSRRWHEGGALIATYATPHSGPENPDIWRRKKGLALWFADLDGLNEYTWYEGTHIWNEFLETPKVNYRNFCIVYPTSDGVVDTIAWEGQREGFDDIRYFTLLKRLVRAALRTRRADLVKLGRRHGAWIESVDWEKGDLDALRLEAAARIVALSDALRAAGVDVVAAGGALPQEPEAVACELPAVPAGASAEALAASAADFAKRKIDDVAERFYAAAAQASSGADAAGWFLAAAEAALRRRDRAVARRHFEAARTADRASDAAACAEVRLAVLPLLAAGYRAEPSKETVARVRSGLAAVKPSVLKRVPREEVVRARLAVLDASRRVGDLKEARDLLKSIQVDTRGLSPALLQELKKQAGELEKTPPKKPAAPAPSVSAADDEPDGGLSLDEL